MRRLRANSSQFRWEPSGTCTHAHTKRITLHVSFCDGTSLQLKPSANGQTYPPDVKQSLTRARILRWKFYSFLAQSNFCQSARWCAVGKADDFFFGLLSSFSVAFPFTSLFLHSLERKSFCMSSFVVCGRKWKETSWVALFPVRKLSKQTACSPIRRLEQRELSERWRYNFAFICAFLSYFSWLVIYI